MNDNGTPISDRAAQAGMEQPQHWTPSMAVSNIEICRAGGFANWASQLSALAPDGGGHNLHLKPAR